MNQRRREYIKKFQLFIENHRHYDDGRCRDARYEKTRRYEGKKHHGKWYRIKIGRGL
jgi:hypothetical protein